MPTREEKKNLVGKVKNDNCKIKMTRFYKPKGKRQPEVHFVRGWCSRTFSNVLESPPPRDTAVKEL